MPVFIGSTPNTEEDDVQLAESILKGEIDTSKSFRLLKEELNIEGLFFNRGRDSLYFLLDLLNLKEGTEVITQAFTCIAVVAPILWKKAIPIYVDIDPKTLNMDLDLLKDAITNKTRVVIIQHTFGNINNMQKVKEIIDNVNLNRTDKEKIYIIEDCAHIFLKNYSSLNIGKYSDAFFFSFSQDKSVSSTQGAMLVINDNLLLEEAKKAYDLLEKVSKKEAKYCAKYICLWSKIKSNYFTRTIPFSDITVGKVLIILFRTLGLIRKQASADTLNFTPPQKMSDIQAMLLLNQIEKEKKLNNIRKDITDKYNMDLKHEFKFHSNNNTLLRYPVLIENRSDLKQKLKERGVISGIWYCTPVFPLQSKSELQRVHYTKSSCPKAEMIGKYVLNLPTNIEVTKEDVKVIVDTVNTFAKPVKIY